jgi:hypothetical protein
MPARSDREPSRAATLFIARYDVRGLGTGQIGGSYAARAPLGPGEDIPRIDARHPWHEQSGDSGCGFPSHDLDVIDQAGKLSGSRRCSGLDHVRDGLRALPEDDSRP